MSLTHAHNLGIHSTKVSSFHQTFITDDHGQAIPTNSQSFVALTRELELVHAERMNMWSHGLSSRFF